MTEATINRRKAFRATAPLAGLLLAALLVWQGSTAAFSAVSDNDGNQWAAGSMVLRNNGGGATFSVNSTPALFTHSNVKPGDTVTRCITVESAGSLGGELKFYVEGVTAADTLAPALRFNIQRASVTSSTNVQANCTGFPSTGVTTLHNNVLLSALPGTYAAAAAGASVPDAGGRVAYRIQWTFDASANNTFQNTTANFDLVWELN